MEDLSKFSHIRSRLETRDKDFPLLFDVQGCTSAVSACDRQGWRKVEQRRSSCRDAQEREMTHYQ